ncbi:MAG: radical SAM protein [Eubacteriales bacterium]|nr:radical SAM protein [Eubacteriales bacterium]MDD4323894.1 radical SAM protein [Eubacteriales bacterium]
MRRYLPFVENFGCFSRVDAVLAKGQDELRQLKAAGFDSLTLGIESGSDKVLSLQDKGVTVAKTRTALEKLRQAGIRYSFYIVLGLGGEDLSAEHQEETAKLINSSQPEEVFFLSLVMFKNAVLVKELRAGNFKRMRPLDCMQEAASIIEKIKIPLIVNGSHKNNIFSFKGRLPEQKELLLEKLYAEIAAYSENEAFKRDVRRWKYWPNE